MKISELITSIAIIASLVYFAFIAKDYYDEFNYLKEIHASKDRAELEELE